MLPIPKHLTTKISASSVDSFDSDPDSDEPVDEAQSDPFYQLDSDTAEVLNVADESTTHKVGRLSVGQPVFKPPRWRFRSQSRHKPSKCLHASLSSSLTRVSKRALLLTASVGLSSLVCCVSSLCHLCVGVLCVCVCVYVSTLCWCAVCVMSLCLCCC